MLVYPKGDLFHSGGIVKDKEFTGSSLKEGREMVQTLRSYFEELANVAFLRATENQSLRLRYIVGNYLLCRHRIRQRFCDLSMQS